MTAGPGARPAPEQIAATVRGAQRGDLMALHELLDLITPYVRRLCGPIALADGPDAAQEALIVVLRNLRSLRTPEALFGWVRVIAVREAVRVARRSARTVPAELGEIPAPGDPALAVDVADVLRRLAPEHRAVLMLRDLEGFDEARAAQLLGVPTGTVRSRLFRARRMFRRAWLADPPSDLPSSPGRRARPSAAPHEDRPTERRPR
jgi:RNA polymerase sigma-70 factor (ECF subfamily)